MDSSTVGALGWALGVWALATAAALVIAAAVVASLPETYFRDVPAIAEPSAAGMRRLLGRLARNVAGVMLIVLGVLLSIPGVPGQGVLTVLVGVILLDFPGRHRLARAIAGWPGVLAAMNRLRHCFGRPPLSPPDAPGRGPERPGRWHTR